jgi:alkanesulfonate monooxygenase SsuD/methylene tetrahydromethanopterin reductase-like flavin-dependent oxidoreductase (luciferase family)
MVTGVTYRQPGVLVKTATTLDVLSGGRAYFGVGAAWFEREHLGLGVAFPPLRERFERLEELLQIAQQMWGEDARPYAGQHYQLAETLCVPRPVSQPHPPILIGGRGEKKTLRLVAKYADATNISVGFDADGAKELDRLLGVLRVHCERERRPYDAIEKTTLSTLWMSPNPHDERWLEPAQALERLAAFRDAGADHVIFNMPNVERPETLEYVGREIVEPAAKL